MSSLKQLFSNILKINASDPDDARRRKLLNILLLGSVVLAFLGILTAALNAIFQLWPPSGTEFILTSSVAVFVGGIGIFLVNRRSGWTAALLFLLLLTVALAFSDSPEEVSSGRSLFVFSIPIAVASLLLHPLASFLFAGLTSVIIGVIALSVSEFPNIPAIMGYFLLALVSWLSSRSLEQAIKELRTINRELDRRVDDRTSELSKALARELVEAGKNQAILEGIADGVIVFDLAGHSIVANPSISRLLEKSTPDLLDKTLDEILQAGEIAPLDRETILSLLQDTQKDMPSVRFRWGERTLLVNAAPVNTGLGDTIGTVVVFRDFTREAEVEQMKNTFVAMVSHELRTPLNAILGYAEMMREAVYGVLNVRQSGVMERIESSSKRLINMVSDLLDQAQMDAGRMKIHVAEFQFSDLVGALHAYMDKSVADKGLYMNVEVDPNLPLVTRGDAQRLGQVLLNLVGNAVKFTERGGVDVRLHRVDENRWGFEVSDTGPGIFPEAQQYVFESFRQVDNVATREHGGIGLGLAIVKNLVQLMGGEISLSSFVGEGSTFTVTLPLDTSKEEK